MVKRALLLCTLLAAGCQDTNSNTNDKALYSRKAIDTSTPEGQRFYDAFVVLEAKCMNCHQHAGWGDYTEVNDWYVVVDGTQLVIPGDAAGSGVISRLAGWGSLGGMPKDDSNLTSDEYTAIRTWIEAL